MTSCVMLIDFQKMHKYKNKSEFTFFTFRKVQFTFLPTVHNDAHALEVDWSVMMPTNVIPMLFAKYITKCGKLLQFWNLRAMVVNCVALPSDCVDVYNTISTESDVYEMKPSTWPGSV